MRFFCWLCLSAVRRDDWLYVGLIKLHYCDKKKCVQRTEDEYDRWGGMF